jgi:transposase
VNIVRTYKFKLYRSKKNQRLHQQIDIAGLVYNHCIARHRRYYRLSGKRLSRYGLMRHITRLKKLPRYAHWNLVGSQAIQDVVRPRWRGARIDKAYNLFFGNLKRKVKTSLPGFKKVKKYSSFTLKQAGWQLLDGNRVRIQGREYAREWDETDDGNKQRHASSGSRTDVQPYQQPTPLTLAGQVANRIAGSRIFERYLSEKSENTLKRHGRGETPQFSLL